MTTYNEVYKQVKELESTFQIPTPAANIPMGVFDSNSGLFSGPGKGLIHNSSVEDMFPQGYPGNRSWYSGEYFLTRKRAADRVIIQTIYSPHFNAVNAILVFQVKNPSASGWSITVNQNTTKFKASESQGCIEVGFSRDIDWKISSGNKSYSDKLRIRRDPIAGVGGFIIPYIPVYLVYEPPCNRAKTSKSTLCVGHIMTTEIKTEFVSETSTTKPARPEKYQSASQAQGTLDSLSSILKNIPNPYAQAAASAMSFISEGLGTMSATLTEGTVDSKGSSLKTSISKSTTIDTGINQGGPGIGDVLCFLKNIHILWIAYNGKMILTPLGWESENRHTVQFIKDQIKQGHPFFAKYGPGLLELDPFSMSGPDVALPPERFTYEMTYDVSGNPDPTTEYRGANVTLSSWTNKSTYTIRVEDYSPGWLSFAGLGVKEKETITTKITQSTSEISTSEEHKEVSFTLCAELDEIYAVDVYFDHMFGSYALKPVEVAEEATVTGTVESREGEPVSGEKITLLLDDTIFGTRKILQTTNKQGRFGFHLPLNTPYPIKGTIFIREIPIKEIQLTTNKQKTNNIIRLP